MLVVQSRIPSDTNIGLPEIICQTLLNYTEIVVILWAKPQNAIAQDVIARDIILPCLLLYNLFILLSEIFLNCQIRNKKI